MEHLKQLLQTFNLIDVWRHNHPNTKGFTWSRKQPPVMCRLDYFFITKETFEFCKKCNILESIRTDHKLVYLELSNINKHTRGRGFYKLNNSLLEDEEYIDLVMETFFRKKHQYQYIMDKRVLWDLLKFEIQNISIEYSIRKARERRELEKNILAECDNLYTKLCNEGLCTEEDQRYQELKTILEDIERYKEQGAQVRSRSEYIEKNEKSNKYFYNKEKSMCDKKTVDKIRIEGNVITDQSAILLELKEFYSNLYSSHNPNYHTLEFDQLLGTPGLGCLTEDEKQSCEGDLTIAECELALNRMQLGKSPGCDGLTVDFYKRFWPVIGTTLVETLNYAAQKGELSQSQKRAVITLLQKRGKDPELIKNWRPVSLNNVDYKILTKSLAIRTEKVLPKIIHEDQSGFVKGRFIGENIRLIDDIIVKLNIQRKTALLLLLDFEKAFDSVEWGYMIKILEKFNFGQSFINWVKTCYTNISSTIINNGTTCGFFEITRGVRQGCPLSTTLFILCIELLAQMIRNNDDIKGIKFGNRMYKISLFADDATCLIEDSDSIAYIFRITESFAIYSGLRINIEKIPAGLAGSLES